MKDKFCFIAVLIAIFVGGLLTGCTAKNTKKEEKAIPEEVEIYTRSLGNEIDTLYEAVVNSPTIKNFKNNFKPGTPDYDFYQENYTSTLESGTEEYENLLRMVVKKRCPALYDALDGDKAPLFAVELLALDDCYGPYVDKKYEAYEDYISYQLNLPSYHSSYGSNGRTHVELCALYGRLRKSFGRTSGAVYAHYDLSQINLEDLYYFMDKFPLLCANSTAEFRTSIIRGLPRRMGSLYDAADYPGGPLNPAKSLETPPFLPYFRIYECDDLEIVKACLILDLLYLRDFLEDEALKSTYQKVFDRLWSLEELGDHEKLFFMYLGGHCYQVKVPMDEVRSVYKNMSKPVAESMKERFFSDDDLFTLPFLDTRVFFKDFLRALYGSYEDFLKWINATN